MLRSKSLLSRIVLLHIGALMVAALLIPLALYSFLTRGVADLHQRALREQAELISRQLTLQPDGHWSLNLSAAIREQYSEAYGRYVYVVLDEAGKVVFSSGHLDDPLHAIDAAAPEDVYFDTRRADRVISGASVRRTIQGKTFFIQVGEDILHRDVLIDDVVSNVFPQVGWVTVPIIFLVLVTDLLIFRRAMQPLIRASNLASQISPTRIDIRLPTSHIPSEILPLVRAVNDALDRLQRGFSKQRAFAADAAHELRTPLAILRARIDTLPQEDSARSFRKDVDYMTRIVSQLLDAADLETLVLSPGDFADLRVVCAEMAEFIAPLALAQDKTISLSAPDQPVWIKGNEEFLKRAVRNLLDNALNHTPRNSDIEVIVDDDATVTVRDNGPGIPLAQREQLFDRFWRRDRRRQGGAGLGLSIVKHIVEAHGGSITVENRPRGGASFCLHFPRSERFIEPV